MIYDTVIYDDHTVYIQRDKYNKIQYVFIFYAYGGDFVGRVWRTFVRKSSVPPLSRQSFLSFSSRNTVIDVTIFITQTNISGTQRSAYEIRPKFVLKKKKRRMLCSDGNRIRIRAAVLVIKRLNYGMTVRQHALLTYWLWIAESRKRHHIHSSNVDKNVTYLDKSFCLMFWKLSEKN